jgi:hypothetical protein
MMTGQLTLEGIQPPTRPPNKPKAKKHGPGEWIHPACKLDDDTVVSPPGWKAKFKAKCPRCKTDIYKGYSTVKVAL